MLPRIWKKLLLAICIIACLFNVTAKIVNRVSLERVISSQKEGVNVRELLNITDETPVVTPKNNTVSVYNDVVTDSKIQNEDVIDNEQDEEMVNNEEFSEEQIDEEEPEAGSPGTSMTQEDFFDKIFNDSAFSGIMGN